MSGMRQRTPASEEQAPATALDTQAAVEGAGGGNDERQQELRGAGGTEVGRASYEALLGQWLGSQLYGAVAPHLTLKAVSDVARQGFEGALAGAVGLLGNLPGEVDAKAVEKFGKALAEAYGPLAAQWVQGHPGLVSALGDWVDTNPGAITTVALLAAAAVVASDMDVPTLSHKLGLGSNLSAEVSAKVGSFRHLALEQIKAKLEYHSGPLLAAVQVEHSDEGDALTASATLGDADRQISANAKFTNDGLEAYGVNGLYRLDEQTVVSGGINAAPDKSPVIHATVTRKDGTTSTVGTAQYDANNQTLTLKGGIDLKPDDQWSLSANAAANLGRESSFSAGIGVGWDDGRGDKARLDASYDSKNDSTKIDAMGQVALTDELRVRGLANYESDNQHRKLDLGLQAAYQLDDDTSLIAGGRFRTDDRYGSRFVPEVGAQVRGVPLTVGYDPATKGFNVGVTIPF